MAAIIRKELADGFSSWRCFIFMILVFGISALALVSAHQGIRSGGSEGFIFLRLYTTQPTFGGGLAPIFIFINIVALIFVPLIGISLGFDAINRERTGGTLSRIMSQPVYRDSVINGKFLSGIIILSIMMTTSLLLIAGYGLMMIGVPPSPEEIIRLFIYLICIIIYGAFWIALSILFSVLFRSVATSIICSVALWMFFGFGIFLISNVGESARILIWLSPAQLFGNVSAAILHPMIRTLGTISQAQMTHMIPNPISLGQSMLLVWPHLTGLISLSVICFAISYILFMRQEIRAT
ncbi:ABC transporter permease [Chloroflexota bacterium]